MNAPAAELARAAELTRVTAERDALAAENARLREAVGELVGMFTDDGFLEVCRRYAASTGDAEPDNHAGPEAYLAWSARVDAWLIAKLAAARALVEAPR